jgi:hypothetical protein
MQDLKIAAISVSVHVVGDRRSAMLDRERQRLDHGLMHFRDARRAEPRSLRQRMDSGEEQNLIDINVAEAGDEGLIQQ